MENKQFIDMNALIEDIEYWYNRIGETMNPTDEIIRNVLSSVMDNINEQEVADVIEIRHGRWVLEESPYAEYEEAIDGESHPRYVCNLCGFEAGFNRDPDGFADFQDRSKWCGGCAALMDAKE